MKSNYMEWNRFILIFLLFSCLHDSFDSYNFITGSLEEYRSKAADNCHVDVECPAACHCDGGTVDCSARGLKEIPRDIPLYTTEL